MVFRSKSEHQTPLLRKSEDDPASGRLFTSFLRSWATVMVVVTQLLLCVFVWAFVGVMVIKKVIPLPNSTAGWIFNNPSEANALITVTSTILAMIVSFLLGTSVQHALTFRLSRGISLPVTEAWIQIARNSLFLHHRRHPWWTLLSVFWVGIVGFLTTAWSSLLSPGIVVRQFPIPGREPDFLKPALADLFNSTTGEGLPTNSTYGNWTLIPGNILASSANQLSQAGLSAAILASSSTNSAFVNYQGVLQFNISTGGVVPMIFDGVYFKLPTPADVLDTNYVGLSYSYSFKQQGYTANVSCVRSSSPTLTLNDTVLVQSTTETFTGPVTYALHQWSWITKCSETAESYTGDVYVFANSSASDAQPIGNGLFATSVCPNRDFNGVSNQSFLFLMQAQQNSQYYFDTSLGNQGLSLPIVCQVTPMVTIADVQYNASGIVNIANIQDSIPLPDDSSSIVLSTSSLMWRSFVVSQGPYSNSMADDMLIAMFKPFSTSGDEGEFGVVERYLQGIIEYLGTEWRDDLTSQVLGSNTIDSQALENMTTPFYGTLNVQTVGWTFHPRTHGIALAVITLVAIVTVTSGIFTLLEANRQRLAPDTMHQDAVAFDPTDLMGVLVASSVGDLATALSQCEGEEDRQKLRVELAKTDEGRFVLNTRDDITDDPGQE